MNRIVIVADATVAVDRASMCGRLMLACFLRKKDDEVGDPQLAPHARIGESLKLVELRGVELDGCSVSTTEDELLALPSSARGRR